MYNLLEADSIIKSFKGINILNGIYIKIETGNVIGIFGRNGSGKSTLLKILFGIEKADFSFFRFNNKVLKAPFTEKNCVFLLAQKSFLPKNLIVKKVLKLFSIEECNCPFLQCFINKKIAILSYGQLRYLESFIALNSKAKFVFLDEPFNGLSPKITKLLLEQINKNKKDKGIILVDHNYLDVLKVTNINMIMDKGVLKKVNKKEDLIKFKYTNSV